MRTPVVFAAALLCVLAFPCRAQEVMEPSRQPVLVHLDTPTLLGQGALAGRVDLRVLGGDEDLTYTTVGVHYGVAQGSEVIVRGTFADRKSFALPGGGSIRHGGSDIEIALKYGLKTTSPMAVLAGVSFASTPAQSDAFLTLGLASSSELGNGVTAYLCPRAVWIDSNTIVGIGLGARCRVANNVALVGDYTPIVAGKNTRDTTTGATKRRDVYGVAVRLSTPDDTWGLDLGWANGTGTTTGFGLTPGLGGDGGFYAALSFRR